MPLPTIPATHRWIDGGAAIRFIGQAVTGAGKDAAIWCWDRDTDTRITDLYNQDGLAVSEVPVRDNTFYCAVPLTVTKPVFSVGQTGARFAGNDWQALLDAAAHVLGDDTAVAALVDNPATATATALSSTYAPISVVTDKADLSDLEDGTTVLPYVPTTALTATLQTDFYIAHRGGAGFAPEETMEAFRTAVACGVDAVECDVQPLADGSLGLMHDATVDRTTDGAGNVADYTAPAWRALNAAADFPWNGKTVPPALLTELLDEFAHKQLMMIEPKDVTNAGQIMDEFDKRRLGQGVILATSSRAVLQAVKARGYVAYFYWGAAVGTPDSVATIVADGADFLGLDGVTRPDAEVTTLVATGKPVVPYTINRRVRRDALDALGAVGYLSDQPVYLKAAAAQRAVDSWRQGVLGHGLNSSNVAIGITSGALDLNANGAFQYAVVGEVSPVANAAGSYTIDCDLGFSTIPTVTTQAVAVYFAAPDDTSATYSGAAGSYRNSYLAYLRANGQFSLYRADTATNTPTLLGSTVATAALSAGVLAHVKIEVTSTTVKITRTDGTPTSIGPISDATYRGGYVGVGKSSTDGFGRFKNLAIT